MPSARRLDVRLNDALLAAQSPALVLFVANRIAPGEPTCHTTRLRGVESHRLPFRLRSAAMGPGTRLGVFEILGPLGSGGMGEVYRARDTRLGREVALKTLPASFASDPSRLARLRREARILASLSHPNIARLFGLEESDGAPVLVMELVEGRTLAEHLLRGALPVAEALDRARQIAAGLEAAHEKGVLHRDLKPSNIAIDPKGSVKLLDFGLARAPLARRTRSSPREALRRAARRR
jgi:serine/threonine protein kinase